MEPSAAFVNNLLVDTGFQDESIRQAYFQPIYSTTSLDDETQPLIFSTALVPGRYTDLKSSFLYLKFKVKNTDGSVLSATDNVAPSNLFGATCFKEVNVYMDGVLVSSCSNYHILSHLKTFLSSPLAFKDNELGNSVFAFDPTPTTVGDENDSYLLRKRMIAGSKLVEVTVPIFDDLFCNDRYIFSDTILKLEMKRAPQELCLVSPSDVKKYKVVFEHCVLQLRKVEAAPDIYNRHLSLFQNKELNYPYIKSVVRVAHFPSNTVNANVENIFNSETLPQMLVVAFMQTDAYNGKLSTNCLAFGRNNVSSIQPQVNNQPTEYNLLSVSDSEYLLAVEHLIKNLNLNQTSIGLNRGNWITGNSIYAWKLYPTQSKGGNLSISIKFASGTSENVTLIAVGQTPSVLSVSAKGVQVSSTLT